MPGSIRPLSSVLSSTMSLARWEVSRTVEWQMKKGWRAGCNFIPSCAVNELEMFQKDTYSPVVIDKELKLAQDMGFRTLRVFLHDLLWKDDSQSFLARLDHFLNITTSRHFDVMFVLLDSCWNAHPKLGIQPEPVYGVHNSQWLQCPGYDIIHDDAQFEQLSDYVKGVVTHFKDDSRVSAWDVWNEPNNSGYADETIIPLLAKVVGWVREVDPSQPITTGIWQNVESGEYTPLQMLQLDCSDVLSFHDYRGVDDLTKCVAAMKAYAPGRPVMCTEYMSRTSDSTFRPHLQLLQDQGVCAYNWGLVSGKTGTIFPWNCKVETPATEEPAVWFHDIFREDGTPFDAGEVEYIKKVTSAAAVVANVAVVGVEGITEDSSA